MSVQVKVLRMDEGDFGTEVRLEVLIDNETIELQVSSDAQTTGAALWYVFSDTSRSLYNGEWKAA